MFFLKIVLHSLYFPVPEKPSMKKIVVLSSICCALLSVVATAQNVNVVLRSQFNFPSQSCANIGGYVDSTGKEYALVGCSRGLAIVDVTNPVSPFLAKQVPGPVNLWKELKTYKHYAYVTSEGGEGLQIVDLRSLPDTGGITYKHWMPLIGSDTLRTIHALHIDTATGYVYLFGSNRANGGIVVADIKTDPWNPVYAGQYNSVYIHDGYVRNDTVYAGAINAGHMRVINFTNKNSPVLLQTQATPHNFTHNTWLSDDGKTVFTTDERSGSYVAAYDVSDLGNITELDRIRSNPGSGSVGHNTHILNDYAVTSWYKDGFTIVDAHRPGNLVQVGNYDTYAGSGSGFSGAWGVYPYLPSGNVLVSSLDGNLYVLSPSYVRACYLEGMITDSITTAPIYNATIQILSTSINDVSVLTGKYAVGTVDTGTYTVQVSKAGYITKTISGVTLSRGNVTTLNVPLAQLPTFSFSGQVIESSGSNGIASAKVLFTGTMLTYTTTANSSGNFTLPAIITDTYTVTAGKWGYITDCSSQNISQSTGAMAIPLDSGYYDDFIFDFGWTVTGNAVAGIWERGAPIGTDYISVGDANPGADANADCGDQAFVTGNAGGGPGDDDVDNGYTLLTSPVFDLSTSSNPYIYYYRWFFNDAGSSAANDSLLIHLDNGIKDTVVEIVTANSFANSTWRGRLVRVKSYLTPTANMRMKIMTDDVSPGHVVEAGFDRFRVLDTLTSGINEDGVLLSHLSVYPNPFSSNFYVKYELNNDMAAKENFLVINDLLGREVYRIALGNTNGIITIDKKLGTGVYLLTIANSENTSAPVKIIKSE